MSQSFSFCQREVEKLYSALADIVKQQSLGLYFQGSGEIDYIDEPDLLVFEDTLFSEEYSDANEAALLSLTERGYRILMNFQEPDNILGNVIVKIRDRWFAFEECTNDPGAAGPLITQIWPLKYVLPRIRQMETRPAYGLPLLDV